MDERRNNGFENRPNNSSGFDSYNRNPNGNGDFKVNISDFEGIPDVERRPKRPVQRANAPRQEDFRVTLPNRQPKRSAAPVGRPAGAGTAKSPAARSSAKNRPAASAGTRTRKPLSPEQIKRNKEKKKYETTRRAAIVCICLVLVTVFTAVLSSAALAAVSDILALGNNSAETVSVVIPENADFDEVFSILCDNKLVNQKFISKMFCKFRNYDKKHSPKENKDIPVEYQPGVYYIEPGSGIEAMLELMKVSRGVSNNTVRLTFPEGWTVAQIFEKIEKNRVCTAENLYANLDIVGKNFNFYKNIPSTAGRYLKAEGYLYPDTYDFFIGESASSVLKKLFSNYQKKWDKECEAKAKELGMTMDEIIKIASIIQREGKGKSQMSDVSSVIHNRLSNKATFPLLEMNSTKDYIIAAKKFGVFDESYYSIYLNSYNTFNTQGLPPGAICNPGSDAIYAALHPNNTDYYFFCHDKEGNIYLASTAAEQQKNVQKYVIND